MPSRTRNLAAGLAALATSAALLLSGCSSPAPQTSEEAPTTLRVPVTSAPNSFAIGYNQGGQNIIQLSVFDTVLSMQKDGSIAPGLATKWEYNEDRTKLTLDIRQGSKFSNGEPVDAAAVAKSLEAARTGPTQSNELATMSSVAAPDAKTVVISLSQPDASVLPRLATINGAVAAPSTIGSPDAATKPVGSGPYVLDQERSQSGSKYVVAKNKDYWRAGDYPFETIEYSVIADPTAAFNGLRSGQLDFAPVTADQAKQLPSSQFAMGSDNPTVIGALWIVDREGTILPPLANIKVRQAINMAFDRNSMEKVAPGVAHGINQAVNPAGKAYSKDLESTYSYNLEEARKLMAEAGFKDGFAVTMPSTIASQQYEPVITQSLKDIGITVNWEVVPITDVVAKILSKTYPMFYFPNAWGASDAQDLQAITNYGVFNPFTTTTPELTKLLSEANASDKADSFAPVNRYLVENAWNAPLQYMTLPWAHKTSISYSPPAIYRDQNAPWVWGLPAK
ncbi:ABC transporter substrate-binding protein [Pseudarthrobacter sp. R1]|uniref:ABC transporter substrate-binding protein n=1 Tax=Pseudarthrobacter sp. R1 TaxID=2944934 RepID=UPI00210BF23E|nr:ABC transporter substrate-binding protein [Pseudarthrobacter sp. R1]MCQ6272304.1 ABC transporter substrate-binding protein [Pseudarthrobacter sp. R1]